MLVESVEVSPGAAELEILEPQPPAVRTWRSDSLLSDPFSEFCTGFEEFQNGAGPKPKLRLADRYVRFALELAENWGPQDKETHLIGVDEHGFPIVEYHLFRRGRAEYVATVVPHAFRNDEIVRVDSPDQAADWSQLQFEVRNRSLAESERRMAAYAKEIAENGPKPAVEPDPSKLKKEPGSGIKPLRVVNVLPAGAVPIPANEDSGSSQAEVRNLCPSCGRVNSFDSSKFCGRHIEELIMEWKTLETPWRLVKSTEQ